MWRWGRTAPNKALQQTGHAIRDCSSFSALGDGFFCEIVGAQFESVQDPDRADAGLACIGEFYNLETLTLFRTRVSDESAKNLGRLTKLRSLTLEKTDLTDNGSACLRGMTKLEKLDLWSS